MTTVQSYTVTRSRHGSEHPLSECDEQYLGGHGDDTDQEVSHGQVDEKYTQQLEDGIRPKQVAYRTRLPPTVTNYQWC